MSFLLFLLLPESYLDPLVSKLKAHLMEQNFCGLLTLQHRGQYLVDNQFFVSDEWRNETALFILFS